MYQGFTSIIILENISKNTLSPIDLGEKSRYNVYMRNEKANWRSEMKVVIDSTGFCWEYRVEEDKQEDCTKRDFFVRRFGETEWHRAEKFCGWLSAYAWESEFKTAFRKVNLTNVVQSV